MPETPNYNLPYPSGTSLAAGHSQIQSLAEALDGGALPGGLIDVVTFTEDGSFVKANYPTARAVRVRLVGGGGGGGGAGSTGSGEAAIGMGGGGGGYSEKLINVSALSSSESVTVGAGGTAGTDTPTSGGDGGTSSFGTHLAANGGVGGSLVAGSSANNVLNAGDGGTASNGDVNIRGGPGQAATRSGGVIGSPSMGGSSMLGFPARVVGAGSGAAGRDGEGPGSGASGGFNWQNQANGRVGGTGADGIVIVEVWA